ncbi:MAG: filamentous hemagglutinin N-terminal domain-containing protein [Dolichospermum sp.]
MKTITLLPVFLLSIPQLAVAQITPDATLGSENSSITPRVNSENESVDLITGGATRGSSLFHSFLEFNVNHGQRVYFDNPANINNIFSRVTGNNVSHILGTLGVYGTANLYLLNPKGIIFGKDAKLDIAGSFFATTANSFKFPDGNEFSAANPQMPLLTMSVPVGVQFGSQPGDISSQGNLVVGKNLTFSAENVKLEGQLKAQTATLEARQDLNIGDYTGISLQGKAGGNINYGEIEIKNTGPNITSNNPSLLLNAVGTITGSKNISTTIPGLFVDLQAKDNINIKDISSNGGGMTLTAGGNIINTESLQSGSHSESGTAGNGGGMTLTAGGNINTPSLFSYSYSRSGTAAGNSGGMTLTAGGNINTQSLFSYSYSRSGTAGNGGGMTLTAGGNINTQSLQSFSRSKSGRGNGGDITIKISEGNIFIPYITSSATGQGGNGGTIQLTGDKLDLNGIVINSDGKNGSNGGLIKLDSPWIQLTNSDLSSSSYGSGKSGQIELNSTGDINLNNSRLFTTLEPGSTGQGGNIEIKAQNLNLTNYAVINTGTYSSGNAGNIKITAENVSLTDSSSLQSLTTDQGNGGNISLDVTNGNISLTRNSIISTSATKTASGNSGNIELNSRLLSLSKGSQIQALTEGKGTSKAGTITVRARDSIIINGVAPDSSNPDLNALPPQNIFKSDYSDDQIITDIGTNNSITTAQQLQASDFYLNNPNQPNGNVEYSTRVPYTSIEGTGDDKIHVYAIKVNADTKAVFDIDLTGNNSSGTIDTPDYKTFPAINTKLTLLDSQGKELASNDDSPSGLGAAGSDPTMTLQQDPYLRYTFTQGGTYYIQVSNFDGTGVPSSYEDANGYTYEGTSYNLQISLETNPIEANITSQGKPSGIFAYTTGAGKAGDIILNTGDLKLENTGQISAFTKGSGNGGSVNITASQNINITGQGKLAVESSGTGNAGDISITSPIINLSDKAKIGVDSTSSGNTSSGNTISAGNITIQTNFLKLDNAAITAKNASGNGGNININTQNLLLRHNSEISTTAGSPNNPGNGGQITINAKNGYVVAVPTEDSDIVANAFGGNGGKIDISAIRVLGLETRGRLNTAQLQTIRTNNTSDLAASSDVGRDGTVAIQSLGIDPSQGLVAIPVNLVDPSGLIAQDCNSNNSNSAQSQSEFVITGRGGLPPSPDDMLTAGALPAKWVTRGKGDRAILPIGIVPTTAPLIEAQGMVRNANGDIVLIAQPVISTNFRSGLSSQLCRITKNQHKL